MRCRAAFLLAIMPWSGASACRQAEPGRLDPVRAIRRQIEPRFQAPVDGRLTDAQIDTYLKVRAAIVGTASAAGAARAAGVDPAEFDWIRARIVEAISALDARRVADAGLEAYGRGLATLRAARADAVEPRAAARIDAEIAALERERALLRKPDLVPPAVIANAARVAGRRARIEAVGP